MLAHQQVIRALCTITFITILTYDRNAWLCCMSRVVKHKSTRVCRNMAPICDAYMPGKLCSACVLELIIRHYIRILIQNALKPLFLKPMMKSLVIYAYKYCGPYILNRSKHFWSYISRCRVTGTIHALLFPLRCLRWRQLGSWSSAADAMRIHRHLYLSEIDSCPTSDAQILHSSWNGLRTGGLFWSGHGR